MALKLSGRPERHNAGTLRRYRFTSGAVLAVCTMTRRASVAPPCAPLIMVPISRETAANALREARH